MTKTVTEDKTGVTETGIDQTVATKYTLMKVLDITIEVTYVSITFAGTLSNPISVLTICHSQAATAQPPMAK